METNSNNPFRSYIPRWLGIIILLLMFFPPTFSAGTYLGNISEMQGSLGLYMEDIQMANNLVFVGMCLFIPFMIPYLLTRSVKKVFTWGFIALSALNIICSIATSRWLLFSSCLLIGFVRIMLMLNCTFTLTPYVTGINTISMFTAEQIPQGESAYKLNHMRTLAMPVLYFYILLIFMLCNMLMTRIAYVYSWRHCYYLEVGILLSGALLVSLTMKDEGKKEPFNVQWNKMADMLLMGIFLVCLCYVSTFGKVLNWFDSPVIRCFSFVGVLSAIIFVMLQSLRKKNRYLLLDMFCYRNVVIASMLFIVSIIFNSSNILITNLTHVASPANDMQIGEQSRWAILGLFIGLVVSLWMTKRKMHFRSIFFMAFLFMGVSSIYMYFAFQNEILLQQLIFPTVFINAGLLIFYSIVAAFGMIKLPPKYLVSFVFVMILTRNAMIPTIGNSIYSNWTYHRQQFYIENFISKVDSEKGANPSETMHKLALQSNLASWKETTGYTIWMIIGMSVITLILPYHKGETS
jgi:MFS family permease